MLRGDTVVRIDNRVTMLVLFDERCLWCLSVQPLPHTVYILVFFRALGLKEETPEAPTRGLSPPSRPDNDFPGISLRLPETPRGTKPPSGVGVDVLQVITQVRFPPDHFPCLRHHPPGKCRPLILPKALPITLENVPFLIWNDSARSSGSASRRGTREGSSDPRREAIAPAVNGLHPKKPHSASRKASHWSRSASPRDIPHRHLP